MSRTLASLLSATIVVGVAAPVRADERPDDAEADLKPRYPRARMKDIVVEIPGERSSANITVLVSLGTAALAGGVLGLRYHLGSKRESEAISADSFTGRVWTDADQANYDDARSDRKAAIWLYAIGGGFLVATIVTFIATAPESTTTVIHPRAAAITPVDGGAVVSTGWRF